MKAWKRLEKATAKCLKGVRRVRIQYSESIGDIIHPVLSVECKYGKQIPKMVVRDRVTYLFTSSEYDYIIFTRKQVKGLKRVDRLPRISILSKNCKFIDNGIQQAMRYDKGKIPLLALKPRNYRGIIFVCRIQDWGEVTKCLS